jgi:hypothetical protein
MRLLVCLVVVLALVREAVAALEGLGQAPRFGRWAFATDGGYTAALKKITTIGYAPGDEKFAQTSFDQVKVDNIVAAAAGYAFVGIVGVHRDVGRPGREHRQDGQVQRVGAGRHPDAHPVTAPDPAITEPLHTRFDVRDDLAIGQLDLAIIDVLARYSRTLDWLDDEGQASCFWPDAAIDYGFFKGSAADFVPVVMAIERGSARRWHFFSPPAIRLVDGAHAEVESYGLTAGARRTEAGGYAGTMYGGRYLDAFEKRGGEWRISRRDYVLDWSVSTP